jgi:hypothetical protein
LGYGEGEWSLWLFLLLFTIIEAIFLVGWATVGDFLAGNHSPQSAAR